MGHHCAGCIQEGLATAMAEKNSLSFVWPYLITFESFAVKAVWPIRQLMACRKDAQHENNNPFYIYLAERFDITNQCIKLAFHMNISLSFV